MERRAAKSLRSAGSLRNIGRIASHAEFERARRSSEQIEEVREALRSKTTPKETNGPRDERTSFCLREEPSQCSAQQGDYIEKLYRTGGMQFNWFRGQLCRRMGICTWKVCTHLLLKAPLGLFVIKSKF